jgi:DNA-nicking Smr family endonuclease
MQARLPVDDEIDLHGLTAAEAETRLNGFLAEALREGCRKVLIIHGKGRRSPGERPVLKELVRQIIKNWAWTDYWGTADPPQGGEGASWVILKTTGPGR